MSIDTKVFENLMTLYAHGHISRSDLFSYFCEEREEGLLDSVFEEFKFFTPAFPEDEPGIFESIENRFEILDL